MIVVEYCCHFVGVEIQTLMLETPVHVPCSVTVSDPLVQLVSLSDLILYKKREIFD